MNPGRRFSSCPNNNCKDFVWVDPPMCQRAVQIIPGLLRRSNRLEVELHNSKVRVRNLAVALCATWMMIIAVVIGIMMN
ncbi:hypothetical protein Vadar_031539 [Vaccinium darrowii]|uniref:Uncharacterized protein n=1 Tax=Vaccinium darrowii TaxID=229202 RepID=A0ACB7ZFR9_9ERIC|nr:hypothetical protein Vadar_031539 [Vaccinium darrowii]